MLIGSFNSFEEELNMKRKEALERMSKIPIAALIWGPNPFDGTLTADCRNTLKSILNSNGHHACFSEELYDPKEKFSLIAQQIAQAEVFDIIFSIPDSPGSIAEIHDFARIPRISSKVITFLNRDWNDGYSNKSLIELESIVTTKIQLYTPDQLPNYIIDTSLDQIRKLQEIYFMLGKRIY